MQILVSIGWIVEPQELPPLNINAMAPVTMQYILNIYHADDVILQSNSLWMRAKKNVWRVYYQGSFQPDFMLNPPGNTLHGQLGPSCVCWRWPYSVWWFHVLLNLNLNLLQHIQCSGLTAMLAGWLYDLEKVYHMVPCHNRRGPNFCFSKSKECRWQDWYIFIFLFFAFVCIYREKEICPFRGGGHQLTFGEYFTNDVKISGNLAE